jgi:ribosomal protein S4
MKNASQLILHGHILVNGTIIRTKSYILKSNDIIEVAKNTKSRSLIKKNIDRSNFWPIPQKYFVINYNTLQILFILNETNVFPFLNHYLNLNSIFLNIKK